MTSRLVWLFVFCVPGVIGGCRIDHANQRAGTRADPSAAVLAYLDAAVDTLQTHSLYRDSVDWEAVRREAIDRAGGAVHPTDVYGEIEEMPRRIGDRHSFFIPASVAVRWQGQDVNSAAEPNIALLSGNVGVVRLPSVPLTNPDSVRAYSTRVQTGIREIDAAHPCGWILDLRTNMGGNMWAMFASVGPLLEEGIIGTFVLPDGDSLEWTNLDGSVSMGDSTLVVVDTPYRLHRGKSPVAILVDTRTASSGEAVVVAFRGQGEVRSFGQPTAGVPSANRMFFLPDSSAIALATAWFADRSGRVYRDSIVPDSLIDPVGPGDPIEEAALAWLHSQSVCP